MRDHSNLRNEFSDEFGKNETRNPREKAENQERGPGRGSGDSEPRRGNRHRGERQDRDRRRHGSRDERPDRGRDDRRPPGGRGGRDENRRTPLAEDALFRGRKSVPLEETDFNRFFLDDKLLKGIAESGYASLTSIQEKMILPLLERKNLIAQASGGGGKTAAYLIPILHTMSGRLGIRVLVITPTRDLAIQVFNEVRRLSHFMDDKRCVLLDPGSSINQQAKELEEDPEIVMGTPGRILDHIRRGNFKIDELDCFVLDEVDRILDHGQRPDVESIMKKIHGRDQNITLSTTISPPVLRLCRKVAEEAVELFSAPEKPTVEAVRHSYFRVIPEDKISMIHRLIEREQPERALVFCRTKVSASRVTDRIKTIQGGAMELHMGIMPRKQEQIIKRFREKDFNLLVTTDTFTHELDVENISHVINFDIPEDPEDYLYRIGKTARLSARGRAMTLVSEEDMEMLKNIESHIGTTIEEEVLPGLEPAAAEERKPAGEPEPMEPSSPVSEKLEPKPQAKSDYIHGGWHRKRNRRKRR
jgi:ATP-dependent RNA helicase DeaD